MEKLSHEQRSNIINAICREEINDSDNEEAVCDSDVEDNKPICSVCPQSPLKIVTNEASHMKRFSLKTATDLRLEERSVQFLEPDNIRKIISTPCCAGKCLRNLCPRYDEGFDREAYKLIFHCRNDVRHLTTNTEYDRHMRQLLSGKRFPQNLQILKHFFH